ncbi:LOW QUALITY PROTEIN: vitamin K epoxide reductase complex subunit 1 [Drosophila gunungcola]|uniref:LOW QUALITY PROTEIN: vitamin K epoxide reductase complex subunit 1 n=1 Tax=Drosophila gunungcola TaxID=103775 RepID=UPI0022E6F1CB|nr:LOW QUALITY PROTEIN: vitamin K epoxide reductase complex subunit 1 [Drosophila gunungcola]
MEQADSTTSRLRWICACGLAISVYSLYVKKKLEEDENYRPICDVNDNISCSLVFKSIYGDGFGLSKITKINYPNGVIGCVFYVLYFVSSFFKHQWLCLAQLLICTLTLFLCVYLAFLLLFFFYDCCLVCLAIYLIHTWLFQEVVRRYRRLYL